MLYLSYVQRPQTSGPGFYELIDPRLRTLTLALASTKGLVSTRKCDYLYSHRKTVLFCELDCPSI